MLRSGGLLLLAAVALLLAGAECTGTDAAVVTAGHEATEAANHRILLAGDPNPPSPPNPPKPPKPPPSPPKPPPHPPKPSPRPPHPPSPPPRPPRPSPRPPSPSPSPPPVCTDSQQLVNGTCTECPVCADQYPESNGCPAWAALAKNPCVTEYYWQRTLCPVTCGFCKAGTPTCPTCAPDTQLVNGVCETCPDCVDTNPSCASWASYGYCNATWAATECKKTCGYCTGPDYTCDPCPTGQKRFNGVCTSTCPECADDNEMFCKTTVPIDGTYLYSNITGATIISVSTDDGILKGVVTAGTLVNGPFGAGTTVTGTLFSATLVSGTSSQNGTRITGAAVADGVLLDAVYGNGTAFWSTVTNATITNGALSGPTSSSITGTLVNGTTAVFTKALGSQPDHSPGSSKVVTQSLSGNLLSGALSYATIVSATITNADIAVAQLQNGTTLKKVRLVTGTIKTATFVDFGGPQFFKYATLVNATFLVNNKTLVANATIVSGGNATFTHASIVMGNMTGITVSHGTFDNGTTLGSCADDTTVGLCKKSCGVCSSSDPCAAPTCPRNMKLVRGVCTLCHACADGDGDYENGNSQYARDGCPSWALEGNCLWNPWMSGNCKKSCGLCDPDNRCALLACKPGMQLHPEYMHGCRVCRCVNNATNCDTLAAGADQPCMTSSYMLSNCPLACGTCTTADACLNICPAGMERLNPINGTCTPCASCVDNFPDASTGCPLWASRGECMTSSYVKDNCVKSCTGCTDYFCRQRDSPPPLPPQPPVPPSPPSPVKFPSPPRPPRLPPGKAPSPPAQYMCCDIYPPATCASYAEDGSCDWNPWMTDYCSQTCGKCTPATPSLQCYCNDRWPYDCPTWTANGECSYNIYLRIYCRVSCNTCGVDT